MGQNTNRKDSPKIWGCIWGLTQKLVTLQAEVKSESSPYSFRYSKEHSIILQLHLHQLPDKTIAKEDFLLSKGLHNGAKNRYACAHVSACAK